jgi:hypothetical protein
MPRRSVSKVAKKKTVEEGNFDETDEYYQGTMSVDETIAASEANYERLLDWNERFENKTSTVITLSTAMIGVLGAVTAGLEPSSFRSPLVWIALVSAFGPLAGVVYQVSKGTTPVLTPPERSNRNQPKLSLVFFGTTAMIPPVQFHNQLLNRTRASYIADLAAQQHQVSNILSVKFGHLSKAYRFLWIAYATFIPACFLLWAAEHDIGTVETSFCWLLAHTFPSTRSLTMLPEQIITWCRRGGLFHVESDCAFPTQS